MFWPGRLVLSSPTCLAVSLRWTKSKRIMSPVPPPVAVRGMQEWQPELFSTTALLPGLAVPALHLARARRLAGKLVLRIPNLVPVQDMKGVEGESDGSERKLLLLCPVSVRQWTDLEPGLQSSLAELQVSPQHFSLTSFPLTLENWTPHQALKAILPTDQEGVSGFSIIGHILHLNLKPHLLQYKAVIGAALLGLKQVRTVVNKINSIDSEFRQFSMELLAGEAEYEVTVKESGCSFQLDFSRVYWNPRLATEHERVIALVTATPAPVLFDACAGVGPFSVPCAKHCRVYSNDLNPESFRWLQVNAKGNKKAAKNMECFNQDAREFIRGVVKDKLVEIWTENSQKVDAVHIVMNLPALAITFLDVFRGLFRDRSELAAGAVAPLLPQVHVYTFSKAEQPEQDVGENCELYLGCRPAQLNISRVRNVAPSKEMMRASFLVPRELLFDQPTGIKRPGSPVAESDIKR